MITKDNIEDILLSEPFNFTKQRNVFTRHYGTDEEGFDLSYNFGAGTFDYPEGVELDRSTTQDNFQKESYVVFLCVAQLFAIGYKPNHIKLEGENYKGNKKGYCDILVKDNHGDEYLIIECKTADVIQKKDDEFRKYWAKTLRNGDQLFRYFNTYRKAKYLCLLAADFPAYKKEDGTRANKFEFIYHLISLIDNDAYLQSDPSLRSFQQQREEQGGSEDFFNVWKKTYKQDFSTRGLLENGIEAFNIGKKSYNLDDLDTVNEYSLQKKYNDFAVILRKYTISSHENAFDKLVNLFLSKIIDEKYNGSELTFLWKGAAYDDDFSLQDRLNILYRQGMMEFFKDEVTYIENQQIDAAFDFLTSKADEGKETIKRYFRQLKYFNNNPFAFLDVHNEELFYKNAVILKDVISMLQGIYLTKHDNNQFLGDLFEGFLNKGVHQSEGQFFTPIPIARFLVSSLPLRRIVEDTNAIPRVIDYACGAGHFLTEYARQIKPMVDEKVLQHYYEQIVGIEKDYRLSKVSQVAAFMYGMDGIRIHFSDALTDIPEVKDHSFDVLIANPPYSVSGFLETMEEEEQQRYTLSKYVSNPEKNNSIETLFIERASQLLASGGVAAIILPSSILTKGNLYMRTRELLLENFDIVAICCFGKNTFGQTSTSTVTLFLRRKAIEPNTASHLKNRVNSWFNGNMDDDEFYKDSYLLDAYLERMGFQREDYVAMMKGELTDTFIKIEKIQEYITALNVPKVGDNSSATALAIDARKVREEAQKYVTTPAFTDLTQEGQNNVISSYRLRFIRAIEKEKLYFYMLAASNLKPNPRPVIVVQAPDKKDDEKKFLGYEWSNRKGAEGIHYLNTGKIKKAAQDDEEAEDDTISQILSVDDINTPLFNPKDLFDNKKINSILRCNFDENEDFIVPEEFSEIIHQYYLTEMLNFDGVEFDKTFDTNVAYKVNFESKYDLVQLKKIVLINPSKREISDTSPSALVSFVEMASVSEQGYIMTKEDIPYREVKSGYTFFVENDIIIAKITPCMENGKCAIASGLTNGIGFGSTEFHVFRCSDSILNTYLFHLLNTDIVRFYAQKNMTGSSGHRRVPESFYSTMEIPLPPKEIQQKISEECAALDNEYRNNEAILSNANEQIGNIIKKIGGLSETKRTLESVCVNLFAGGDKPKMFSATPTDSCQVPIYSNGIANNGLYGYTNEAKETRKCITISARGTIGFTVVRYEPFVPIVRLIVAVPNETIILAEFLRVALLHHGFTNTGGATPQLTVPNIKSYKIVVPDMSIQQQIVNEITEQEAIIESAQSIMRRCSSLKQAVLEKYLKP